VAVDGKADKRILILFITVLYEQMEYWDCFAYLIERILIFIDGFLIAIPIAGFTAHIHGYWIRAPDWKYHFNTFFVVIAGFSFLLGVMMMVYAVVKTDPGLE
jgi:hypothetical protein